MPGESAAADSRAAGSLGRLSVIVDPNREENRTQFEAVTKLQALANEVGLTLPHLAMAFTQAHPSITSAIVGARTIEQLRETLKGSDICLSTDTLDAIDAIVPPGVTLDVLEKVIGYKQTNEESKNKQKLSTLWLYQMQIVQRSHIRFDCADFLNTICRIIN